MKATKTVDTLPDEAYIKLLKAHLAHKNYYEAFINGTRIVRFIAWRGNSARVRLYDPKNDRWRIKKLIPWFAFHTTNPEPIPYRKQRKVKK